MDVGISQKGYHKQHFWLTYPLSRYLRWHIGPKLDATKNLKVVTTNTSALSAEWLSLQMYVCLFL